MSGRVRPRTGQAKRRVLAGGAVVAGLAVLWFVGALALFVAPRQEPLREADAIVTLAPAGARLPSALDAFDDALAPRLWLSSVPDDEIDRAAAELVESACADRAARAESTTCFIPSPVSTLGEARAVGKLVAESGARSVIVTTHISHSARARFLFESCLPEGTEVQLLLVDEPDDPFRTLRRMAYETGAFVKAAVEASGCR